MTKVISLFIALLFCQDSFCQTNKNTIAYNHIDSLEGKWSGRFLEQTTSTLIPIEIIFQRKGKRITVYSYTQIKTEIVICTVDYKIIGRDSIYLIETADIQPIKGLDVCFQTMKMHISPDEDRLIMIGEWETPGFAVCGKGTIYLEKVR